MRWWSTFYHRLPPDFDAAQYLHLNPDVAEANVDPVRHFLEFGRVEGRLWQRGLPRGFVPSEYLGLNPDLAKAKVDPVRHFLELGRKEGRSWKPGLPRGFDPAEYLSLNPDLGEHNGDLVRHYLDFGRRERRKWKRGVANNAAPDEIDSKLQADSSRVPASLRSVPVCAQRSAVNENKATAIDGDSSRSGYRRVSLLVPTRNRPEYLKALIESYFATTSGNNSDSEIVFRVDFDDPKSLQILSEYDFPVIVGPRRRGYGSLPAFYNEMARLASGDILMCCNDDVVIETPGWPPLIIQARNRYPDGIFNIGVSTTRDEENYIFSCVSRKFVDRLGFINDERLVYSDIFLLDVAKHFNRLFKLWTVRFRHDWAGENYGGTVDHTRADARCVEFETVLADATGSWRDEYRGLHESAVAEAVARLDPDNEILAGQL